MHNIKWKIFWFSVMSVHHRNDSWIAKRVYCIAQLIHYIWIGDALLCSFGYMSYIEANLISEEESAYWIAPIFSDFFSSYVDPKFPGLRGFLHEHNEAGMEIAEI
jgi:hypothetical protein